MTPITDRSSTRDKLIIEAIIPHQTPETVFEYWVDPELLSEWWPEVAEVEPRIGGKYYLGWDSHQSRMPGTIILFSEGKSLGFTWKWDHDPEEKESRAVFINFAGHGNGTLLTILHEK